MKNTTINHNATKAAFGKTNGGEARAFVIDEKDFTEMGDSYYVTDAKEMMRILDEAVNGTISVYNVGDCVLHKVFGKGMVVNTEKMGNDTLLEISFDKAGTKKLMANFSKMEKI